MEKVSEKVFSLSLSLPLVTTKVAARLKRGHLRDLVVYLEIATVVLKKKKIGVLDTDEIKPIVSQEHLKYPLFTSIFERFA